MRRWTMAALMSLTAAAGTAHAAPAYQVDPAHSEVSFQIRHLVRLDSTSEDENDRPPFDRSLNS